MTSEKKVKPIGLSGVVIVALFAGLYLASCGGGGSSSIASAVPPGGTPPLVPPPPSTCTTTSGPLTLAFNASRTTGVAPLAVFFDATASTSTNPIQPFHELEYRWAFDSTGVAPTTFWATGSRAGASARNLATGPIAAHVFRTPGTYTITLSITDGTTTVTNNCALITVLDPNVTFAGTLTTCVNASGTDHTGCPLITNGTYADSAACRAAGRCVTQVNFDTALASHGAAGTRVVFHGGQTFFANNTAGRAGAGPTEIGAYGTGRPVVRWNGATPTVGTPQVFLSFGNATDLRIVGIEFDGQNTNYLYAMAGAHSTNNLLFLNNRFHHLERNIQLNWLVAASGFFVIDNSVEDQYKNPSAQAAETIYQQSDHAGSNNVAIIGNRVMGDSGGVANAQGTIRTVGIVNLVVSHNTLSGNGFDKTSLDIRSNNTKAAQYSLISNNAIENWGFAGIFIRHQDKNTYAVNTDAIVEGNYIYSTGLNEWVAKTGIVSSSSLTTIRNNLIDATPTDTPNGIVFAADIIPVSNVKVYNNSFYTAQISSIFTAVTVVSDASATGNEVKNNLVYSSGITATVVSDTGGKATKSNNTGDAGIGVVATNPFLATPTSTLTTWRPVPSAYPSTQGATVPIFSDFFGASRSGLNNLGAVNP